MFHSLTRRDKCLMNSRVCLWERIQARPQAQLSNYLVGSIAD